MIRSCTNPQWHLVGLGSSNEHNVQVSRKINEQHYLQSIAQQVSKNSLHEVNRIGPYVLILQEDCKDLWYCIFEHCRCSSLPIQIQLAPMQAAHPTWPWSRVQRLPPGPNSHTFTTYIHLCRLCKHRHREVALQPDERTWHCPWCMHTYVFETRDHPRSHKERKAKSIQPNYSQPEWSP